MIEMTMKDMEKMFQESQYDFPYHYIPHFKNGIPQNARNRRGIKYLGYLLEVKKHIDEFSPCSVLDVGCGDGRFLGMISEDIKKVGIDISEKAISFAQAFHPGISWQVKDVQDVKSTFDIVTAIEVLEHIPEEEVKQFILGLGAACVSGGRIIVTVPSSIIPVNKKHYRHYDWELLIETFSPLIERGFEIQKKQDLIKKSVVFGFLRKLLTNGKWVILEKNINKVVWNYFLNYILDADENEGEKLLLILKN